MIKKEFLMALSVSLLLLGGCVDSSTGAAARADMEGGEAHKTEAKVEKKVEAQKEEKKAEAPAQKVEEKKAEAPAPKAQEEKKAEEKPATEAPKAVEINLAGCAGCHGADFGKAAMGKSKIVKDMSKADIVKALKGYKDGSYGGAMKGIMKGQAGPLSDAQIEAIANKIGK